MTAKGLGNGHDEHRIDGKVLARVRKLLAMAEHPRTSPEEAEAFSDKAAALMAKHLIDQSLLDDQRPDRSVPVSRMVRVPAPYAMPKAVLLSAVAGAAGVRVVIGPEAAAGRDCTLVGFALDVDATELLFTSLLLQAAAALPHTSRHAARPKAFRRAFLLGYAASVGDRLRAIRRDAAAAADGDGERGAGRSAALVLVGRDAEVDAAVDAMFPRLRTVRTTVSDRDGLVAGRAAGADADFGVTSTRMAGRVRPAVG